LISSYTKIRNKIKVLTFLP